MSKRKWIDPFLPQVPGETAVRAIVKIREASIALAELINEVPDQFAQEEAIKRLRESCMWAVNGWSLPPYSDQ